MQRREFLIRSASGLGAAWLTPKGLLASLANQTPLAKFTASDTVTLGRTGIKTSRLAMGTGTVGSGHHSNQTALGVKGLSELLLNGYDHGLRFFDAADAYGSHAHVAEALKHVQRDQVTVLTKTWARDAATARADLDRFRRELGTDYLDGGSSGRTGVRATALRRCGRRRNLRGWKLILRGSIRLDRIWTLIRRRWSAFCGR